MLALLGSYTERSVSGRGVHVICRGALPDGARRRGPVEMYDRAQCAKAVLRIQGESPEAYAVLEEAITAESNSWVRATMAEEDVIAAGRPIQPDDPAQVAAAHDSDFSHLVRSVSFPIK